AKYLITDTSFPPYFIKKKDQVYLNTWHGTPLKAMGRIVPRREYALGNIQRNFLISDYLLYQNDFSKDVFLEDYMIKNIYPGKVLLSGYPRNSIFFNNQRRDLVRKECGITDKQVIVYMPTWRGLFHHKETNKQLKQLARYFAQIDEMLNDSQVFYVKLHPYVKDKVDYSGYSHIREFPKEYESYDFLNASDALVTDYSSIMFDDAVTKNKIILFAYDREEYLTGRGLYLKLEDMGLPIVDNVEGLIAELGTETKEYKEFYERFCNYDSADTPARVIDILLKQQETSSIKTNQDRRETVLLFIKGFKKDVESPNRLEMINAIDTDKYDVYVCMKTDEVKNNTEILSELRKEIGYFPIIYDINYTRADYFISKIMGRFFYKGGSFGKVADKLMKREKRKYFGDVSFDYVIHQSCQDKMIGNMCLQLGEELVYNFSYFNPGMLKQGGGFSRSIKYFMKLLPKYDWVVVGKGSKGLKLQGENIIFSQDSISQANEILQYISSKNIDGGNKDASYNRPYKRDNDEERRGS
ncbi:MAG: hypothetical protein GX915_07110, partial [Clostridiales bacterium]|nr:hypothetical protein [Clostridiales bacterium]